ncbi:MAG: response regulator transcription factor [Chloroflexi bacterium]|nr:response regulator transcription factor [Chloroflexota bacterium]
MSIKKIKVIIADDHVMVRQGFMVLLNAQPDIEVIGEAADGNEMVELAENLRPDVVLADISMPNLNGIEATKLIHQRWPDMPVVMITIHTSSSYVIRALRNGARGYVVKNDDFQHVIQAIKTVSLGQRYLSSQVSEQIIDAVISGTSLDFNLDERISIREREILQLIAEGNTNSQIARKLVISARTVETHRTNIMRKLELTSQIDILRYAIQHGIAQLE